MNISLKKISKLTAAADTAVLIHPKTDYKSLCNSDDEFRFVSKAVKEKQKIIILNRYSFFLFLINVPSKTNPSDTKEAFRKAGYELQQLLQKYKIRSLQIDGNTAESGFVMAFTEGLALSAYRFVKYFSKPDEEQPFKRISVAAANVSKTDVEELHTLIEAVYKARDLVNEPSSFLTAKQFAEEIAALGKEAGFETDAFGKNKIKSLKMGGLLAVNAGSPNPPTFSVLRYKHPKAKNKNPYVLVGKGVVFDTGGLSLKTPGGMEDMKCDMAGGAAVASTIYALAKNEVPAYVVGLIPATENRPSGNALAPGDVITMHNGKTVEVLNTDAEGRLILADALSYASKYKPELVIDVATLTGAAARAVGKEGIVYMGSASKQTKTVLEEVGQAVYERLVEFPIWDEYGDYLKSDIADLKNIGGADAGAITAGKFLEEFTDYPWLHLDIAGSAFLSGQNSYRGKNATGVGVRLLYEFIKTKVR